MAGEPFNYNIQVANPFASLGEGLKLGLGVGEAMQAAKARELEMAQKQRAAELQAQQQQAVSAFLEKPDAMGALRLSAMLPPDQAKSVREGFSALTEDSQKSTLGFSSQVLAAFQSGNNQVGIDLMKERAAAARNSGDENNAKAYETYAKLAEMNPGAAMSSISAVVGQLPGGDKVLEGVFKAQKAPAEAQRAQAEATTADVKAQYAGQMAEKELEKSGWDIKKLKNDIDVSRRNAEIYRLNARIAQERNAIEQQKLQVQLDELKRGRDQAINDRAAEAESAQYNIVDMQQSVNDLRNHPGFGSLFGASLVPGARFVAGSDTAGAESALESLKARAFVLGAQKMRGLGALGEKEGAKIEAALASLKPGMPERDAKAALRSIEVSMQRLDELNQKKYGVPAASTFASRGASAGAGGVPTPMTEADYNALPSGAVYIDPDDGKQYRKP